jgi:hypothetical protein
LLVGLLLGHGHRLAQIRHKCTGRPLSRQTDLTTATLGR